jgi:hypothetical protein
VQERQVWVTGSRSKREVESLLTIGSALAWGALAVSVWSYVEQTRARKLRRRISDRLLAQVFPAGRVD